MSFVSLDLWQIPQRWLPPPPPHVSKTSFDADSSRAIASSKAGLIIVPKAFHLLTLLPCFVSDGVRTLLELILIRAIFLIFSSP